MRGYAICGLLFLALPAWADPAVDKIMQCMRANVPPALRIQDIELQATDRAGATRRTWPGLPIWCAKPRKPITPTRCICSCRR